MAVDLAELIKLVMKAIEAGEAIADEIKKEANARKRKKFKKATKKVLADPSPASLAAYRDKLHTI